MADTIIRKNGRWELRCDMKVFKLKGLTTTEKLVYLALLGHSNEKTSMAYPSNKTLADCASCCERQISRVTSRLVECNLLTKTARFNERGEQIGNLYEVFEPEDFIYVPPKKPSKSRKKKGDTVSEHPDTQSTRSKKAGNSAIDTESMVSGLAHSQGGDAPVSSQEHSQYNNKKHIPPIAPQGGESKEAVSETENTEQAEAQAEDFDLAASSPSKGKKKKAGDWRANNPNPLDEWFEQQFWPNYPRHVDKKRARNTFMRVLAKARSPEEQKDWVRNMGVRLARYIHDVEGREEQYIKHPSTWLNAHDFSEPPEENEILRQEVFVRDGREAG